MIGNVMDVDMNLNKGKKVALKPSTAHIVIPTRPKDSPAFLEATREILGALAQDLNNLEALEESEKRHEYERK